MAALAAALLLSAAVVVPTAPSAAAVPTAPSAAVAAVTTPAGGYGVLTTTRWTSVAVLGPDLRLRWKVVPLTRAFGVAHGAVTDTAPVRPQLTVDGRRR